MFLKKTRTKQLSGQWDLIYLHISKYETKLKFCYQNRRDNLKMAVALFPDLIWSRYVQTVAIQKKIKNRQL